MQIGFIGLGIMGSRMAANLQKAGYTLAVYNRSAEKAAELVAGGARLAATPADAAQGAEVLITIVAHPQAVEAVALGPDGFLDALPKGALWIDSSTTNPSFARRMAAECAGRGLRFLDAPVGGTKGAAEAAQLRYTIGGEAADVEAARPLFEVTGASVAHVGGHGMGISMKLIVNMLLGNAITAFGEALALGQALGIPKETLLNVLIGGPAAAPVLGFKRAKIESGDYTDTEFPLQWLTKDMHMAAVAAFESGAALPITNASEAVLRLAVRHGLGEQDFAAIVGFLEHNEGTN